MSTVVNPTPFNNKGGPNSQSLSGRARSSAQDLIDSYQSTRNIIDNGFDFSSMNPFGGGGGTPGTPGTAGTGSAPAASAGSTGVGSAGGGSMGSLFGGAGGGGAGVAGAGGSTGAGATAGASAGGAGGGVMSAANMWLMIALAVAVGVEEFRALKHKSSQKKKFAAGGKAESTGSLAKSAPSAASLAGE